MSLLNPQLTSPSLHLITFPSSMSNLLSRKSKPSLPDVVNQNTFSVVDPLEKQISYDILKQKRILKDCDPYETKSFWQEKPHRKEKQQRNHHLPPQTINTRKSKPRSPAVAPLEMRRLCSIFICCM